MFMGPTRGPSGADRTQVGPMLAPWTMLSGVVLFSGAARFLTINHPRQTPHLMIKISEKEASAFTASSGKLCFWTLCDFSFHNSWILQTCSAPSHCLNRHWIIANFTLGIKIYRHLNSFESIFSWKCIGKCHMRNFMTILRRIPCIHYVGMFASPCHEKGLLLKLYDWQYIIPAISS